LIPKIVEGELGVAKSNHEYQTCTHTEFRSRKYKEEIDRWNLRKQIILELSTQKRLDNDDKILLTKGGALPNGELKFEKNAYIVIGLPASGKSTIAAQIADSLGAVIVDSDFAKRKLPEFKDNSSGASVVHKESSEITYGFTIDNPDKVKSLYEICLENQYNIIIPKIGNSVSSILSLAKVLAEKNKYKVHLILISLTKRDATIRAMIRYHQTNRYVPLGLIFDGYGNDPILCYYYLRCIHQNLFESFGAVTTNVPIGTPPFYTDILGPSPVSIFDYKEELLA